MLGRPEATVAVGWRFVTPIPALFLVKIEKDKGIRIRIIRRIRVSIIRALIIIRIRIVSSKNNNNQLRDAVPAWSLAAPACHGRRPRSRGARRAGCCLRDRRRRCARCASRGPCLTSASLLAHPPPPIKKPDSCKRFGHVALK